MVAGRGGRDGRRSGTGKVDDDRDEGREDGVADRGGWGGEGVLAPTGYELGKGR